MTSEASQELLFASLAAGDAAGFYADLVAYLSLVLRRPMRLSDEPAWQLREQCLIRGAAHVGVMCGLQYVCDLQSGDGPGLELLAAPVMRERRYRLEPVYFSDVVVAAEHPARKFENLAGCRFAFNERTSHSGYGVVRYALAVRGFTSGFFSSVVESNTHQRSLALVGAGAVDAAAIDSTVLETEFLRRPDLRRCLRVVTALGPSPIPPLVVSRALPHQLRNELRNALLDMHRDRRGLQVLSTGRVHHYVEVRDSDYDPIRMMATAGAGITL
jgi:phosphonate transport system substrate-binding protein